MITLIYLALAVVIVLTNFLALGLWFEKHLGERNLARFVSVVVMALVMFFVEHWFGLGDLAWLWPVLTAASVYLLWQHRVSLTTQSFWWPEAAFLFGFFYALAWRFLLPDINPGAEEMTDLYFIANYRQGMSLPPEDLWLSGYLFDFYYAFQHYAIALFGRIFDFNIGVNYNLAWPVVAGLITSLAWSIAQALNLSKRWSALFSATVLLGGSGVTVFSLLFWQFDGWAGSADPAGNYLWASVRAIGGYGARANGPLGEWLASGSPMPILPIESTAYLLFNGDLHPPLGSFMLALSAAAGMLWIPRVTTKTAYALTAWVTATAVLMMAVNAWVFPLQALFVLLWLLLSAVKKQLHWPSAFVGGAAAVGLLLPFLSYFAGSSLSPSLTAVADGTPWQIIFQWWPLLVALPIALWQWRSQAWLAMVATIIIGLLFTLGFYFADGMTGQNARFNTALKWWSYLNLLMLIALAMGLTLARYRWVVAIVMLGYLSYLPFSLSALANSSHQTGAIAGHQWFTQDPSNRDLLNYLKQLPRGITLEAPTAGAYTSTTRYALFAELPSYIGWYGHQGGWRGYPNFLNLRAQRATRFYDGQMSPLEARQFIDGEQIDYVLWTPEDVQRRDQQWLVVDAYLSDKFAWVPFYDAQFDGKLHKVGIWQRVR